MIYIITGGRSSGKTETIKRIFSESDDPSGFISCKQKENKIVAGYNLFNPAGDELIPFISDKRNKGTVFTDYEENSRFIFNKKIYDYVYESFRKDLLYKKTFFLDEIGRLELECRKGFYKTLKLLFDNLKDKDLYLTVSDKNIDLLLNLINEKKLDFRIIRKKNIAAVITASGMSSRFGNQNKLLSEINGMAIYKIMLEKIIKADIFFNIIIVSSYKEILKGSENYWNVTALYNEKSSAGISESVKCGVRAAGAADGYMFFPCDQVLLSIESIKKITEVFIQNSGNIICPVFSGRRASPSVFPCSFKDQLLKLAGDNGGREVINKNMSFVMDVAFDDIDESFDIDTAEDLIYAEEKLKSIITD